MKKIMLSGVLFLWIGNFYAASYAGERLIEVVSPQGVSFQVTKTTLDRNFDRLIDAIYKGNVSCVQNILRQHPYLVNVHKDFIGKFFVKHEAGHLRDEIEAMRFPMATPLHYAIMQGKIGVIKVLLDAGALYVHASDAKSAGYIPFERKRQKVQEFLLNYYQVLKQKHEEEAVSLKRKRDAESDAESKRFRQG